MTDLCFRIVGAARQKWEDPSDPASYVASVAADQHLPRYFRRIESLAAEPRTRSTLASYWAAFDQDAQFILRGGLSGLIEAGELSSADEQTARAMLALEDWANDQGAGYGS